MLERLAIVLIIVVATFFWKWGVVSFFRFVMPKAFGRDVSNFDPAKQFWLLGWDLASTSVGLYVAGLITSGSTLDRIATSAQRFGHVTVIVWFLFFVILYSGAVLIRYSLLDSVNDGASQNALHRWFWCLTSWVIGFSLLGSVANLALITKPC